MHQLIARSQLKEYCFVSSFDHEALREMELVSASEFYKVRTLYIQNFYNHVALPPMEELLAMGDGVNISYEHLTREVVDTLQRHGKIVSVWIDCEVTTEGMTTY